jgi:hypothetical protein
LLKKSVEQLKPDKDGIIEINIQLKELDQNVET